MEARGAPIVTDAELIARKLAQIETCVREIRELGQPAKLGSDVKKERFLVHSLQLAMQAALEVASHIVSDESLGEPRSNRELFASLARAGWVSGELAAPLARMAGFRNLVVHGYETVDLRLVQDVVTDHLDDLVAFAAAIRAHL